jgi:hypothetical protein
MRREHTTHIVTDKIDEIDKKIEELRKKGNERGVSASDLRRDVLKKLQEQE